MVAKEKVGDAVCATLIISCSAELLLQNSKKRRVRKIWVKNWLKMKNEKGAYNNILNELKLTDSENFRKYLRKNTAT